ncbi:hypothetical protein [Clostridium sp. M14]|uniref:hypothetical protein n=1 Tax=Clostridium sp. M14 TaxID=2716311 RepID=UPI0013EE791F|nr:hypothetical protein [Clostridium sp. M14]MBZ9693274.1 hypothetical protein [Clostridium sp. M14]
MNKNDEKILMLKNQIREKKNKLNNINKFTPITNCSIELDDKRYNINVLTKDNVISLLIKLNTYKNSAIELDLLEDYIISGYKIEDWITDLKNKSAILSVKDEERKLKTMENKLNKLLSDDKKVELELNEIENLLL